MRLKGLLRGADYIIVTKEGMTEGSNNDDLVKFLYQLEPDKFQGSTAVKNKFAELVKKDEEKQALLRTTQIFPTVLQM